MIKLGIIGCGVIGQTHIQTAAVLPGVSIVALADLREAVVREVAAKFNVPQTYNTAAALLANTQVDAVIIALPTAGRVQVVLQALAAGKHLLVEKPIGMNADEVRQMIAARGDRIAGCCQSRMRLTTGARTATEFIAQGSLGDLRVIRCRAWAAAGPPPPQLPPVWRLNKQLNGGGILVNWGCYDLDYLLGLTGWRLQPRHVLAQTWQIGRAHV